MSVYFAGLLILLLALARPITRWLGPSTERTARRPLERDHL